MAHLTPMEILARAKEFQPCADYAAQNNYINGCAINSYAAIFWAARAALAYVKEFIKQTEEVLNK